MLGGGFSILADSLRVGKRLVRTVDRFVGYSLSALAECRNIQPKALPLVSVIIATYNRPKNLELAIESVLAQTYPVFEVLVVGDACTDETEQLVKSMHDSRIKWLSLDKNSGSQSLPNNLGIAKARGKYVAYLGHDDIWLPNHLRVLVGAMERHSLEVATSRSASIGPPGSNAVIISGPNLVTRREISGPPSSLCHLRKLIERSGGWKDYKRLPLHYPPDTEFISRLSASCTRRRALRRLTVIKLNAAWRTNSYKLADASEQQNWLEKSRHPHRLVLRLLASAASLELRQSPITLPTDQIISLPGEHIVDTWRRIKGLPAR